MPGRNKTIILTQKQERELCRRCLSLSALKNAPVLTDTVICADCIKAMALMPAESVDLLIADPPYNMYKDFGKVKFTPSDRETYLEYTLAWLTQAKRLLKPTASVYVCCDWRSSSVIEEALSQFFTVRSRITWQREKGRGAKANWKNSMEDIWYATLSDDFTFDLDAVKQRRRVKAPYREGGKAKDWREENGVKLRDTCPSNFWDDICVPYWSMAENTEHPTQKPEKLIAKLILASSREGDTVFDPFLGSGTTAVTAKKLKRHYIGIECEKRWCADSIYRLDAAENDPSIQGYEGGVFWERNSDPGDMK